MLDEYNKIYYIKGQEPIKLTNTQVKILLLLIKSKYVGIIKHETFIKVIWKDSYYDYNIDYKSAKKCLLVHMMRLRKLLKNDFKIINKFKVGYYVDTINLRRI